MRLFIAIPLPAGLCGSLGALQARLAATRADVRWVAPVNYHLTVKFLGETAENLIGQISSRLDKAASEVPAFPLALEGLDRLPARGPARVIVCPAVSPDQRLTKLHRLIDSGLGGMGLALDTRVLVPHLTLGRVSSNHGLNRLLRLVEKHAFDPLGSFEVTQVTLYHSVTGPRGPQYAALHSAALAAKLGVAIAEPKSSG